jgi:hypothetical protein
MEQNETKNIIAQHQLQYPDCRRVPRKDGDSAGDGQDSTSRRTSIWVQIIKLPACPFPTQPTHNKDLNALLRR